MHTREVRLGLVLYGGVSLCIYENGIVQEIYRAICGKGLYRLIGELIDSDIVVDVISGTSAGGVNGVMLAYALANGTDFLQTARLWRELGDIDKLLLKPDDPDGQKALSLLNSVYYQNELTSCYKSLQKCDSDPSKTSTDTTVPPLSELDLFVTGTDAYGVISTVYDDLGHPIDVKNHRALFQLQYRGDRKNDFKKIEIEIKKEDTVERSSIDVLPEDLATLSRLTSGFPVAFEPISIGSREEFPKFHRWGNLDGPAIYMDGGILNNKPFTSTITAISSRTATREVERFLIYVEPSPETFEKKIEAPKPPTIVEAGLWSLTSIPSYQSIAADLEAIEAHNERCLKVQKIVEALGDAPPANVDCLDDTQVVPRFDNPCATQTYLTARLLLVKDAAVEAILNSPDGRRDLMTKDAVMEIKNETTGVMEPTVVDRRRSGRLLVQSFWQWGKQNNPYKTLVDYDVFFRKRRINHLASALMAATKREPNLKAVPPEEPVDVPVEAWEAVNHFFKLYEIAGWAMKSWLTTWTDSGWEHLSARYPDLDTMNETDRNLELEAISKQVWGQAATRLDHLMQCGVPTPDFVFTVEPNVDPVKALENLEKAKKELAATRETYYVALRTWMEEPSAGSGNNFLKDLDNALTRAIRGLLADPVTKAAASLLIREFCRFLDVDRQLLPVQIGSGFESTDVIRVVRFSPLDAKRGLSAGSLASKVRGTALANFGAFFKKSWRASDIMVGRFDAACLLTECLLTKERLTAMALRYKSANTVFTVKPEFVASCLPRALPGLAADINAYFAAARPSTEMWEKLVTDIVLAAQQEIEEAERPVVAKCALDQQYAWGQYQKEECLPSGLKFPAKWKSGKVSPDAQLVSIAAEAICGGQAGLLPPFKPQTEPPRAFSEEVPETVIEEHASLALVRLSKSLAASIPGETTRKNVEGNLIFKITMQWLPGYFYRLTHARRTQPDWMLVPIATFLNLALLVVLVLAWRSHWSQGLSLTYALLATAGVAAAALAQWVLTRARGSVAIGGMVLAILAMAGVGFWFGYKNGNISETSHSWAIANKCFLSVPVIAIFATPLFRHPVLRIVGAALAVVVLLEYIWK